MTGKTGKAQNSLLDLEELEPEDLERIRTRYTDLAKRARHKFHNKPYPDPHHDEP